MHDVGTFDRFARAYDLLMPRADRWALRTALAHARGPVEVTVDLAGGSGRGLRSLPSTTGLVVDAAPGMARQATARGLAAVIGDAGRLPLAEGTVDAVIVVDALHHLPEPNRTLREAARVLRPGGVVVVAEFDPTTLRGRALAVAEGWLGFDSAFLTPAELGDCMAAAGLEPTLVEAGFGYVVSGVREREE